MLRDSGVQAPSCVPLAEGATGQTPKPSCVRGVCAGMRREVGGDGEFLDNYLSVRIVCRFRG